MALKDGRRFGLRASAGGGPLVIAPGLNRRVQDAISRHGRIVTYDHAGTGESDPGPLPRTPSANIGDLREQLAMEKLTPPYILVGYSAWAFDALFFGLTWPDEVAGIALIDPSITRMYEKLRRVAPSVENQEQAIDRPDFDQKLRAAKLAGDVSLAERLACQLSEFDSLTGEGSTEIEALLGRGLGDIPLIVLTALRPPVTGKELMRTLPVWLTEHERYRSLSSSGQHRFVAAKHNKVLEEDEAELAILDVIEMASLRA